MARLTYRSQHNSVRLTAKCIKLAWLQAVEGIIGLIGRDIYMTNSPENKTEDFAKPRGYHVEVPLTAPFLFVGFSIVKWQDQLFLTRQIDKRRGERTVCTRLYLARFRPFPDYWNNANFFGAFTARARTGSFSAFCKAITEALSSATFTAALLAGRWCKAVKLQWQFYFASIRVKQITSFVFSLTS